MYHIFKMYSNFFKFNLVQHFEYYLQWRFTIGILFTPLSKNPFKHKNMFIGFICVFSPGFRVLKQILKWMISNNVSYFNFLTKVFSEIRFGILINSFFMIKEVTIWIHTMDLIVEPYTIRVIIHHLNQSILSNSAKDFNYVIKELTY